MYFNKMNSENLANKVEKSEPDLVFCDFKECVERGQYIRCYFDLHKNCPIYRKREFYKRDE